MIDVAKVHQEPPARPRLSFFHVRLTEPPLFCALLCVRRVVLDNPLPRGACLHPALADELAAAQAAVLVGDVHVVVGVGLGQQPARL